jgi:hypothetical protein
MGAEGLEPSRPYGQQILSLLRLPFRHAPVTLLLQLGNDRYLNPDERRLYRLPYFL